MHRDLSDLSRLRPAGGKHSSKRDRILRIFLQQEGHLSADDLFDLVRREAPGIGRATVYRTLQWMVDAGIARKVDFGEGRSRYEPSYGHPRHFHLICNDCHRSSEFLSSDIESLIEEVAAAREFHADADGGPDLRHCARSAGPAGTTRRSTARRPSWCSRATRCGWRSRPSAAAWSSTRAPASLTKDRARPDGLSEARRPRSASTSARSKQRYRELVATRSGSSNRGRRFCSSRARRTVSSTKAPRKLRKGVNDQQALLIGIKCERGSHKFFKRYGERFEDSRGQTDLSRVRRRGARAPRAADPRIPRAARAPAPDAAAAPRAAPAPVGPLIDLHTHTTASDGRCTPAELVARAAAAGVTVLSVTDHDTVAGCAPPRRAARGGHRVRAGHRDHGRARRSRRPHPRLLYRRRRRRRCGVSRRAARAGSTASGLMVDRLAHARHRARRRRHSAAGARRPSKSAGRPWIARALVEAGYVATIERSVRTLAGARAAGVRAARGAARRGDCADSRAPAASRRSRIPGSCGATSGLPASPRPVSTRSRRITPNTTTTTTRRYRGASPTASVSRVSGGSDYHADASHGALRQRALPRDASND